jgi:hypothetical protein
VPFLFWRAGNIPSHRNQPNTSHPANPKILKKKRLLLLETGELETPVSGMVINKNSIKYTRSVPKGKN